MANAELSWGDHVVAVERSQVDDDEIDVRALWSVAWSDRYLIIACSVMCILIAGYLAFTAKSIYRAEVTVTEVREGGMGAASSIADQLGGLATLAGVSFGDGASQEARAILKSRYIVEEFIRRYELLPVLSSDDDEPTTLWRAVGEFQKHTLTLRDDKRGGTTTLSINWTDPAVAAQWANNFVALTNEIMRTRAIDTSKRNVAYLNDQIAQTNVVELRRVLYNLVESETKTLMLANARPEYAFTVVDPAVAPEIRVSPKRSVMIFFGAVLGGVFGAVLALIRDRIKRRKRARAT